MRESQDCWDIRWNKINNFTSFTKMELGWKEIVISAVYLATVMQDLWQMAAIVTKHGDHALVSLSGCTVLKF